jgi:hypothetical protein
MFNWPLLLGDPFGIALLVILALITVLAVYTIGNDFINWLQK